MITVYDLLEVDENASKEEIEKSYQRLIMEYHKDPKLTEEENRDNEIILNKLKLAYDILSNDEKRDKYDKELAKKRAEELIKNVSVEKTEEQPSINEETVNTQTSAPVYNQENGVNSQAQNRVINQEQPKETTQRYTASTEEDVSLTEEEKRKLAKAAQKEFKTNLKKAQKAEEEYNRAYNEAYNDYLRKLGYTVKEPWTLKRVKNLVISLLAIIIFCVLVWTIPFTRNLLIKIYEENFIIKSLVDIVVMLFNAIIGAFKG